MYTIKKFFDYYKQKPGDINEHMETLYQLSLQCDHITEMGVRDVVSTWAFLLGNPKKFVCYDVVPCPVGAAESLANKQGIQFEFHIADTGDPETVIEQTDLLFIDTWHIYEQLKQELSLHSSKVNKFIVMHDTTTFGSSRTPEHFDCYIKPGKEGLGLWYAVDEFILANKDWRVKDRYTNNSGLTVLEKVNG